MVPLKHHMEFPWMSVWWSNQLCRMICSPFWIKQVPFQAIALSVDIAKKYRQVALDAPNKDFHRLLWRNWKDDKIKHMRMKRVTYAIASSAFHSTLCIKEVAHRTKRSAVAEALNNSFFVDDFLGGADSLEEARKLRKGLYNDLSSFGFELRKWTCSHPQLSMDLPIDLRESSDQLEFVSEKYKIKALGIYWKPNFDEFVFSIDLLPVDQLTKELSLVIRLKSLILSAGSHQSFSTSRIGLGRPITFRHCRQ